MGSFAIQGLDGLLAAMKALPKELVGKSGGPASRALRKAANVIRDDARSRAPVRTGALKANIATQRDSNPRRSGASERMRVGVRGGAKQKANTKRNRRDGTVGQEVVTGGSTFYWRFHEFGTEKMAKRPFLVPAFEANKEKAIDVFATDLRAGLDRVARKVART